METTYTPGEVSKLLGIPSSTLRRYVNQFADHLSSTAIRQRNREFTEPDVHILARVRDLLQQGVHIGEIGDQLGEPVDQAPAEEGTAEELPSQTALLVVRRLVQVQQDQADEIAELRRMLAELQAQIDEERSKRNRSLWDRIRGK